MTLGVGLRPNAKALELPPNPTVRAPVLYPTAGRRVTTPLDGNTREVLTCQGVSTQGQRIATNGFETTIRRCRSEGCYLRNRMR